MRTPAVCGATRLRIVQTRNEVSTYETIATLREHWPEVREAVGQITAHTGTTTVTALGDTLEAAADAWGLRAGAITALLHPERLFTGAIERQSSDSNVGNEPGACGGLSASQPHSDAQDGQQGGHCRLGDVELTRGECLAVLDEREALKRVCRSIQHHLADIKAAYYAQSAARQPPCDAVRLNQDLVISRCSASACVEPESCTPTRSHTHLLTSDLTCRSRTGTPARAL